MRFQERQLFHNPQYVYCSLAYTHDANSSKSLVPFVVREVGAEGLARWYRVWRDESCLYFGKFWDLEKPLGKIIVVVIIIIIIIIISHLLSLPSLRLGFYKDWILQGRSKQGVILSAFITHKMMPLWLFAKLPVSGVARARLLAVGCVTSPQRLTVIFQSQIAGDAAKTHLFWVASIS